MYYRKYYALKRRVGYKMSAREKLTWHWRPTPGYIGHEQIVGTRRASILFRKYCFRNNSNFLQHKRAIRLYWRTHPLEWKMVLKDSNE